MRLNVVCYVAALALLALSGTAHAEVTMHGVLSTGSHSVLVDSVSVTVDTVRQVITTSGWGGDSMFVDTFDFPPLENWPIAMRMFIVVNGRAGVFSLAPVQDSWFIMTEYPPTEPRVMFYQDAGSEEAHGSGPAGARLTALPNMAAGHTAFQVRTQRFGRFAIEVYDAAGNLRRTLSSHAAGTLTLVPWTGDDDAGNGLPEGVYYCSLVQRGASAVCKVILAR
jgi:hypothetical protein